MAIPEGCAFRKIEPSSDDFKQGIQIHENEMDEKLGNDVEMITYWVNNPHEGTQCIPYGLYKNGEIIGFFLLTVFTDEGFAFGDYISISKKAKGYGTISALLRGIIEEMVNVHCMPLFFDIELNGRNRRGAEKLYKTFGAGLLECKHFIPCFDSTFEKIPARMLVYPSMKFIDKDTYTGYLRRLFLKDYIESLAPFLKTQELTAYSGYICEMYKELIDALPDVIYVS